MTWETRAKTDSGDRQTASSKATNTGGTGGFNGENSGGSIADSMMMKAF